MVAVVTLQGPTLSNQRPGRDGLSDRGCQRSTPETRVGVETRSLGSDFGLRCTTKDFDWDGAKGGGVALVTVATLQSPP